VGQTVQSEDKNNDLVTLYIEKMKKPISIQGKVKNILSISSIFLVRILLRQAILRDQTREKSFSNKNKEQFRRFEIQPGKIRMRLVYKPVLLSISSRSALGVHERKKITKFTFQ
jgi:hypothetical protein